LIGVARAGSGRKHGGAGERAARGACPGEGNKKGLSTSLSPYYVLVAGPGFESGTFGFRTQKQTAPPPEQDGRRREPAG